MLRWRMKCGMKDMMPYASMICYSCSVYVCLLYLSKLNSWFAL